MKVKCKACYLFIQGVCSHFKRKRSPGKKRECAFHKPKPPKRKVIAPYFRFMSKADRGKLRKQSKEDLEKRKAHQREVEQKKLVETALSGAKAPQEKINLKKPNIFKRLFNRQKIF